VWLTIVLTAEILTFVQAQDVAAGEAAAKNDAIQAELRRLQTQTLRLQKMIDDEQAEYDHTRQALSQTLEELESLERDEGTSLEAQHKLLQQQHVQVSDSVGMLEKDLTEENEGLLSTQLQLQQFEQRAAATATDESNDQISALRAQVTRFEEALDVCLAAGDAAFVFMFHWQALGALSPLFFAIHHLASTHQAHEPQRESRERSKLMSACHISQGETKLMAADYDDIFRYAAAQKSISCFLWESRGAVGLFLCSVNMRWKVLTPSQAATGEPARPAACGARVCTGPAHADHGPFPIV
jgi:hypothetical protein